MSRIHKDDTVPNPFSHHAVAKDMQHILQKNSHNNHNRTQSGYASSLIQLSSLIDCATLATGIYERFGDPSNSTQYPKSDLSHCTWP